MTKVRLKDVEGQAVRMITDGLGDIVRLEEDFNAEESMLYKGKGNFDDLDRLEVTFVATYRSGQQIIIKPALKAGEVFDPLGKLDDDDGRILLPGPTG
jgi:hypothetical protein